MERGILELEQATIKYNFLKDQKGVWLHFFYTVIPNQAEQIKDQLKTIESAELELFKELEISNETCVAKRFFSSDLINHHEFIDDYKKRQSTDFFLSLTEQPAVPSVKLALLGFCTNNISKKYREDELFYFDTVHGHRHVFVEHLMDIHANEASSSEEQTKAIFDSLENKLSKLNTSIAESVLRTWIYAPHVDADYPGIVKARKEIFEKINLTKDTHYIASTGIQGGTGNRFARVFMDTYAVIGLKKEKIRYIEAPEHLSRTDLYGVTFERATAVDLESIDYLFISGTASIDKEGDVVHPGDIENQTKRTLENISALLSAANFEKEDLSSFIVYLRDPVDYPFVKPKIDEYCKNLPVIYVKAPVCRPGWLIEIEGTAEKLLTNN